MRDANFEEIAFDVRQRLLCTAQSKFCVQAPRLRSSRSHFWVLPSQFVFEFGSRFSGSLFGVSAWELPAGA